MEESEFKKFANLSGEVYQLAGPIDARRTFPNLLRQRTYDQSRYLVRYIWIEEEDRFIVCFRGSIVRGTSGPTVRSWHLNFKVPMKKIPFGINSRLHVGYLHEASLALRRLQSVLTGKKVVVCGHSQGGALALCFAVQLFRFRRVSEIEVLTFGQPRVGSGGLCRYLDLYRFWPVDRLVNAGDGVACVPFGFMGYDHCETPSYLHEDGTVTHREQFGLSVLRTKRHHPIDVYIQRLERL
ncbi:MAG: lipase family protein [Rhodobacteraceae bacterium]|nr:lipase family protein [Paracoccaceae bacterium]